MKRLQVTPVTKRVYCVQRTDFLSCSYFVVTDDGVVLIDSGMDVDGEDIEETPIPPVIPGVEFPNYELLPYGTENQDFVTRELACYESQGEKKAALLPLAVLRN